MRRKETLDYDGIAKATIRWQPYAGMMYFHMPREYLSDAGELEMRRSADVADLFYIAAQEVCLA